jgi:hypothetical protein
MYKNQTDKLYFLFLKTAEYRNTVTGKTHMFHEPYPRPAVLGHAHMQLKIIDVLIFDSSPRRQSSITVHLERIGDASVLCSIPDWRRSGQTVHP